MRYSTHGFDAIVDTSNASAEDIIVVVKAVPVFSRDTEDLGDWYLSGNSIFDLTVP